MHLREEGNYSTDLSLKGGTNFGEEDNTSSRFSTACVSGIVLATCMGPTFIWPRLSWSISSLVCLDFPATRGIMPLHRGDPDATIVVHRFYRLGFPLRKL